MSKAFLAAFLFVFTLSTAGAQVVIPDSVAVFFLQQHERAKVLKSENKLLKEEISILEDKYKRLDNKEKTYKADSLQFTTIITARTVELNNNKAEVKHIKKIVAELVLALALSVVIIILILL